MRTLGAVELIWRFNVTVALMFLAVPVFADAAQPASPLPFSWGFRVREDPQFLLTQCQTYPLFVAPNGLQANSSFFTLRIFVPGRVPLVVDVGSDAGNLSWLVEVPYLPNPGFLLSVVDEEGKQGGVKGPFTLRSLSRRSAQVTESPLPTTQSPPPSSSSNPSPVSCPSISSSGSPQTDLRVEVDNVQVETCGAIEVSVNGGTKPYSLTFVTEGQQEDTVLMDVNEDKYTWTNLAPPNRTVLVSVKDSAGNLGLSSAFIVTHGSTNTSCSSVASPAILFVPKPLGGVPQGGLSAGGNNLGAITAGVVGGVFVLVVAIWFAVKCRLNRSKRRPQYTRDWFYPSTSSSRQPSPAFVETGLTSATTFANRFRAESSTGSHRRSLVGHQDGNGTIVIDDYGGPSDISEESGTVTMYHDPEHKSLTPHSPLFRRAFEVVAGDPSFIAYRGVFPNVPHRLASPSSPPYSPSPPSSADFTLDALGNGGDTPRTSDSMSVTTNAFSLQTLSTIAECPTEESAAYHRHHLAFDHRPTAPEPDQSTVTTRNASTDEVLSHFQTPRGSFATLDSPLFPPDPPPS